MKASELVSQLNQLIKVHGDKDVLVMDPQLDQVAVRGISLGVAEGESDEVTDFLICDEETFLAFCE